MADPHVIVDSLPADSDTHIAVILAAVGILVAALTFVAVLYQIWLARRTLVATNKELRLSQAQLAEAQKGFGADP